MSDKIIEPVSEPWLAGSAHVLPSESPPLSDAEYAAAVRVCEWARRLVDQRGAYIAERGLDPLIHNPAANWDPSHAHFIGYDVVAEGNRGALDMLRLFSQVYSGHLMGLKLARGMPIPREVPENLDAHVAALIAEIGGRGEAWWMVRRAALIAQYPALAALSLPIAFGESGFRENGMVVNHDVFAFLERLALMQEAGIPDALRARPRVTIMEIGSGFGGLALLLARLVPNATYICVDLPESLCFAALYLGRFHSRIRLVETDDDLADLADCDFAFVPNYMFDHLVERGPRVDLAINTLSMSEMTPDQVRSYCKGLRRLAADTGVFFEQNHDNRGHGLSFAAEIAAEVFGAGRPLGLPMMDLTQGAATLWR